MATSHRVEIGFDGGIQNGGLPETRRQLVDPSCELGNIGHDAPPA